MRRPRSPVFLARGTYRRRRLEDAARFLPFLGGFAFIVPVLWSPETSTAGGLRYLFLAWVVLIVLSFLIARRLPPEAGDPAEDPGHEDEAPD